MPVGEARRRCPSLTMVNPEHGRYGEVSSHVFEIMRSITPVVEGISIDEAFLDVSGLRLHHSTVEEIGESIRIAIRSEVGIPSSVGIASTKFVAKLASKHAKPDGLLRIPAGTELDFLHPLDVAELWGVGEATRAGLSDLGIRTIGDVADTPVRLLEAGVGRAAARRGAAAVRVEPSLPNLTISAPGTQRWNPSAACTSTGDGRAKFDPRASSACAASTTAGNAWPSVTQRLPMP